jgi:Xaa-Pro aminopeptidase
MKKNEPNRYITRKTGCLVERHVIVRRDGSLHEIVTLSVPTHKSGASA